ncbi:metallophosphoesterase family protein [Azospirillum canadense]|uniref:metallophosphoesterase family protein n=1 Tax=Azospirillum canadense TaxID=403962 RepID=UPI002227C588|nr:metallophosphoesterase [Azospirillum canadense]MCW2237952.1 3',5'-cyclic AMP phosphodiesterase CpdA [Azospirillum canadense]
MTRIEKASRTDQEQGLSRRTALSCMAWVGTGVLWTVAGGVPRSLGLIGDAAAAPPGGSTPNSFTFVQVSDSHIGFNKEANPDVGATLRAAIDGVNALPVRPAFAVHTGDVTHLSKPEEFDTAAQLLGGLKTGALHVVPGEHDVLDDTATAFRERYAPRDARGNGWYSFDEAGVHFLALVNVMDLKAGGLGNLGEEQLAWLEDDLRGRADSTPIVVLAHIPLWSVYPEWGWGTADSERALAALRRFGSVTVLNGHIHQVMQKVEGRIAFHTAMSTAFPQPAPGSAPSPGPMKVPADQLRRMLGVSRVEYVPGTAPLALVDTPLIG